MGASASAAELPRLFLVFFLDEQLYGVPVTSVREIIPMVEITQVPNATKSIKGVINLRGTIVPVVDLRRTLKFKDKDPDERTCIVVTDTPMRPVGFMADRVTDCLEITDITEPEENTAKISADSRFVRGVGKHDGRIIIILDLESLLSPSDRKVLKSL